MATKSIESQLLDKVNEHSQRMDRIRQEQSEHYRILTNIEKTGQDYLAMATKHEHTLYGNGQPGMDEQIRNIVKWIDEQKQSAERRRLWWDKLQWIVIPIGITGLLAFVGQFIVFWLDIVPKLQQLP